MITENKRKVDVKNYLKRISLMYGFYVFNRQQFSGVFSNINAIWSMMSYC